MVINAVAAAILIRFKNTNQDGWSRALASIIEEDASVPTDLKTIDSKIYQLLRWCYDKLPDDVLKICFLNCVAFVQDKEIVVETLLEMLEAEGLLK